MLIPAAGAAGAAAAGAGAAVLAAAAAAGAFGAAGFAALEEVEVEVATSAADAEAAAAAAACFLGCCCAGFIIGVAFLCGDVADATTGFFAVGGTGSPFAPSDAAAAVETGLRRAREGGIDAALSAWCCWRRSGDDGGDCLAAAGAFLPEVLAPAPPRVAPPHLRRARSMVRTTEERARSQSERVLPVSNSRVFFSPRL